MNILIFEDEIYNFRLLRHIIANVYPDYDVIGPISSVEEGRVFLAYHHDIDLIIADIQLNDGLCFDALSCSTEDIPVIFVTAYDEYALKAFEFNSLSYLLKPIDEEQLRKAIKKALRYTSANAVNAPSQSSTFASIAHDTSHRQCFLVKTAHGGRRIHISMVRFAVSVEKTTFIHLLDGASFPVDLTLTTLSAQLNPTGFMRVHRKYIVPLEQVKGTEHLPNGRIRLLLYGIDQPDIIVSRNKRKAVINWLSKG